MNVKAFFVAALSSALDLGIANPEDVLRHVTPDVLATHLPRPLWARLVTACLGAQRVDAELVVETIGVANLCEHIPTPIIWACLAELAGRALGGAIAPRPATQPLAGSAAGQKPLAASSAAGPKPVPLGIPKSPDTKPVAAATPPPTAVGPSIPNAPLADLINELEAEDNAQPARGRPAAQRFRQTNTNIGRLAATNQQRRPQAAVPIPPVAEPGQGRVRRTETDADFEIETDVHADLAPGKDDWKNALAVEDEQLVDWSSSEETMTSTGETPPRRR